MSRILVVDDDPSLAWITSAALTRLGGHEVHEATSAAEALQRLRDATFDVVLLDAMMPGLDGAGLLELLRVDPELARVPVVMLTARTADADRARFVELGARGVIAKPYDPKTLHLELERLLAERTPS